MNENSRIVNFDFLRGFFVILALCQHYTFFLNVWYLWFVDWEGSSLIQDFHRPFRGALIEADSLGVFMAWCFTPWVSQIYLALAAFNLSKRNQIAFQQVYLAKLSAFAGLFFLFFIENAAMGSTHGERWSFYPLMAWMVVLSLLAVMYRYCSLRVIVSVYVLSLFHALSPLDNFSHSFELAVESLIGPDFEYDARLHYFLSSGILGLLLGHLHFRYDFFKETSKCFRLYGASLTFLSIWLIWGEAYQVNPANVFEYEHFFSLSFTGVCFHQALQIAVLTFVLQLHCKEIHIPRTPLHWVGENSLLVFVFHRIFFIGLIAPMREILGGIFQVRMTAYFLEVLFYSFISCSLSYLVVFLDIPDKIFRQR